MLKTDPALQAFLLPLRIKIDRLYRLSYRLSLTYRELAAGSADQFFPTAITSLPTGHEKGRYLAVYLGLNYLRVAFIELLGEEQVGKRSHVRRTLEKAWPIENRLRQDQADSLFAWIGDCIAEVIHDDLANSKGDAPEEITMAISFCFPTKQTLVNEAILMPTGKGFMIKTSLNLHQSLLDGYERHKTRHDSDLDIDETTAKRQKRYSLPKLKITVMTNDSISTLASLAYSIRALPNTRVVMGLIVGAGCNAAVPMKLADLQEIKTRHIREQEPEAEKTIVSTEWTLRGASGPLQELDILTKWDSEVDAHSSRPGFQPLECMIGGRFIGELVRIICFDWFHGTRVVPLSSLPAKLVERWSLTTDFLSLVVAPSHSNEQLAHQLSQKLPVPDSSDWKWTPEHAGHMRSIAAAVQDRSAALVAAATVGLLACTREIRLRNTESEESITAEDSSGTEPSLKEEHKFLFGGSSTPGWQNGPEELVVAVSGGVMQHYPYYKESIQRYIDRLIINSGPQSEGKSVFLREASDGGIIGVGVLAGTVAGEINDIIGTTMDEGRLVGFRAFIRPLSVADVESCIEVESVFPPPERCSKEKFIYRLTVCPELCLGLFVENPENERRPTLVGHVIGNRVTHGITDGSMDMPQNWNGGDETVVLDGEIIGNDSNGRNIGVHSLAIRSEYQGKGIGRALMNEYVRYLRGSAASADSIVIITYDRLVKFYESVGFRNLGISDCSFGGGGWNALHHDRGPTQYYAPTNREKDIYTCESTAYKCLHDTGLCGRGIVPKFYGVIESLDPKLCQPHLKMFLNDEYFPNAIVLGYIPDMRMLHWTNNTDTRRESFIKGTQEIHQTFIQHSDIHPRNMMVVESDPTRAIWIDFDRTQTFDKFRLTERLKGWIDFDYEIVKDVLDRMEADAREARNESLFAHREPPKREGNERSRRQEQTDSSRAPRSSIVPIVSSHSLEAPGLEPDHERRLVSLKPIMTVRSRSSLRFAVRREDHHRAHRRPLAHHEERTTISHSKSAPNLIQKYIETSSSTGPESLGSAKTPLQSRRSRSRRRSPLASQQPIELDHVDEERPYKKPRLEGHFRESTTRYPLRDQDQDRAESPDPLNAISSPVDTAPARPPARPSQPAFVTVSPSSSVTRATRRSLRQLPVAVDDDAEKHDPVGLPEGDNSNNNISRGATQGDDGQAAPDGTAPTAEKRSLRSQAGGSRSKSELAMYFQNYEQMLSLEAPKPEFLTGDTTVVLVDDLTQPPLSSQPPSSPSRSQRESGPGSSISPFGNPLLNLHDCEKVKLPKVEPDSEVDPLGDEHFFKAHRRVERQEKQLRNIERERAQHEKIQLDRLLDELQGHDWLRVMGISGITDTEKKLYEPKRAYFIKEVSALIDKFRVWKEEEKRRKLERGQHLRERETQTPAPFPDHEPSVETPAEEVEEEVEEADEEKGGLPNGTASSDIQSFGEPPDINDVDAWAARQLLEEARSASGGKRAKAARSPSPTPPPPPPPPEPEKPFTSFYAKRYLRDAALGHHRRGRTRTAFGQPIPEMEEREFQLPPDILTEEAIQSCQRKRRRMRRASQV
ncbi:hexokinase family protein [Paecilomyces variotii No. 5]|uniref:Hexokinase family protein n=1 Tax=Byssochlamys spectabilis (strain No. 5 / NBRC 109023) TaxID=1356009 RepID=V5FQC6_BYSSN|nr:hexokinase family protein [Paecilomyces variotii No. 5]